MTDRSFHLKRSFRKPFRSAGQRYAARFRSWKSRFGISITKVSETLQAVNATPEVSRVMALREDAAVFNTHRTVDDQSGRVVELSDNYVRADHYYFSFTGSV